MKRIILYSICIAILCFSIGIFENKSMAYTYTENNVTYTRSDTKNDTAKKALKKEKNTGRMIFIGIIGGVLSASIICGILVSKHKPVRVARAANNYLDNNRVTITRSEDFFKRSSIDKLAK